MRRKKIKIFLAAGCVSVTFDGRTIASSISASALARAGAPLRIHVSRAKVDADGNVGSVTHRTWPYKGVASCHTLKSADAEARHVVWSRPDSCVLVEPIRDHPAFWCTQIRYEAAAA